MITIWQPKVYLSAFAIIFSVSCSSLEPSDTESEPEIIHVNTNSLEKTNTEYEKDRDLIDLSDSEIKGANLDTIDEGDVLTGNIGDLIEGVYESVKWNDLYIQFYDSNKVRATYDYQHGELVGTYNEITGKIKGWWCEKKGSKVYSGEAEFVFINSMGAPRFTGQWREGKSGKWTTDWNLNKVDKNHQTLKNRINSISCRKP